MVIFNSIFLGDSTEGITSHKPESVEQVWCTYRIGTLIIVGQTSYSSQMWQRKMHMSLCPTFILHHRLGIKQAHSSWLRVNLGKWKSFPAIIVSLNKVANNFVAVQLDIQDIKSQFLPYSDIIFRQRLQMKIYMVVEVMQACECFKLSFSNSVLALTQDISHYMSSTYTPVFNQFRHQQRWATLRSTS